MLQSGKIIANGEYIPYSDEVISWTTSGNTGMFSHNAYGIPSWNADTPDIHYKYLIKETNVVAWQQDYPTPTWRMVFEPKEGEKENETYIYDISNYLKPGKLTLKKNFPVTPNTFISSMVGGSVTQTTPYKSELFQRTFEFTFMYEDGTPIADGFYNNYEIKNGKLTVTLDFNESTNQEIFIDNLSSGIIYTVKEVNGAGWVTDIASSNLDGESSEVILKDVDSGVIQGKLNEKHDDGDQVEFTNDVTYLMVVKEIDGEPLPEGKQEYTMEITFDHIGDGTYPVVYLEDPDNFEISEDDIEYLYVHANSARFTLDNEQKKAIYFVTLPKNAKYSVKEITRSTTFTASYEESENRVVVKNTYHEEEKPKEKEKPKKTTVPNTSVK